MKFLLTPKNFFRILPNIKSFQYTVKFLPATRKNPKPQTEILLTIDGYS